jgi:hypothetical protein
MELADEQGDRGGIMVDRIDWRVHHVVLSETAKADEAKIGVIVEIGRAPIAPRPADRYIAELAKGTAEYRPSEHRAIAEAGHVRVLRPRLRRLRRSHLRGLEALRRGGKTN